MNYCECKYGGSPSAHHDNCNSCHKKIKTIYEKYDEALAEIARLKAETNPKPRCLTCNNCLNDTAHSSLYCTIDCYESKESSWYSRSITKELPKMLPCKHCGADTVDIECRDAIGYIPYVNCYNCHETGPEAAKKTFGNAEERWEADCEVIKLWNEDR